MIIKDKMYFIYASRKYNYFGWGIPYNFDDVFELAHVTNRWINEPSIRKWIEERGSRTI
uniref:Uncharacterized protein n=1 Tax=Nelumbo nucifera TaxID=4432 RepID=A0A822YEF9_NELNU|nr:TPA_asm: hypothetical protein HUJ06_029346 [Nelumbo nucifera]